MSDSTLARESTFSFPWWRTVTRDAIDQSRYNALTAELQSSLARENALREEKNELLQRQAVLAQEFEHRLINSLQLIASLLSLQSRAAKTPEVALQLTGAARRVVALGRVHHQLHLLDQLANVEFKQFLVQLCDDLSSLLFEEQIDRAIVVEGSKVAIPTVLARPLGLIVNELITNSVKYATGNITVRIEKAAPASYSLSVKDDGPGLPAGFEAAKSKGLGMRLILSMVREIGAELQILPRDNGFGAYITVTFRLPRINADGISLVDRYPACRPKADVPACL
jgi:two-component sensor histidine kinase